MILEKNMLDHQPFRYLSFFHSTHILCYLYYYKMYQVDISGKLTRVLNLIAYQFAASAIF